MLWELRYRFFERLVDVFDIVKDALRVWELFVELTREFFTYLGVVQTGIGHDVRIEGEQVEVSRCHV